MRLISSELGPAYKEPLGNADGIVALQTMLTRKRKSDEFQSCVMPYIFIIKSLPVRTYLSEEGASNAFFAALERSMFDAYTAFAYKMCNYIPFEPYAEQGAFLQSVGRVSFTNFLGIIPPNKEQALLKEMGEQSGISVNHYLRIPFAPLLSSCFTTTILFAVYVIFLIVVRIRSRIISSVNSFIPLLNLDSALFSIFGGSVALLSLSVFLLTTALAELWRLSLL